MEGETRKDPKGRKLKTGETYDFKTGRYRYSYNDADGKRCQVYSWTLTKNDSIPFDEKGERRKQKSGESLREKEQKIQEDRANHINSQGGNMTVYELMCLHIDLVWNDRRETTKNGYRTWRKYMEKSPFGKRKIRSVTSTDAEKWFMGLHKEEKKSFSSLHTLRGILKPAFERAKKNRWVYHNPFDFPLSKKAYGGVKMRDALSRENMRRFLDFVRTDKHFSRYFNGFYILFHTGLRISEFCGLTVDDIDFKEHVIYVRRQLIRIHNNQKMLYYIEEPKTENGARIVPMLSDVEKAFREVIANRPKLKKEPVIWNQEHTKHASGFLWFDRNNGIEVAQHWQNHLRWARNRYNHIYKKEIPPITPHVCRHTFCSNLATSGISPKTLQKIMGHSSIEITLNIYTHLEDRDVKKDFYTVIDNKQYDYYPFARIPETVSTNDAGDDEEEPEVDFAEAVDDDE